MTHALERRLAESDTRLISTDVFDTVLLRDWTTETERLAIAATRAAHRLEVDPRMLRRLRWEAHDAAYRAVALTDPAGEATLARMARSIADVLGLKDAADVIVEVEVEVDREHLRPNRRLVAALSAARARGVRVVAVSDTYYSAQNLRHLFATVLPTDPYDAVYASADEGRTKHHGALFSIVAERERVDPASILHLGDNVSADVVKATLSGWRSMHTPRSAGFRLGKFVGAVKASPLRLARAE